MSALHIDREGVRIFLSAAHEAGRSAGALMGMYRRRKDRTTVEARALISACCTFEREAREDVEALRTRGGLLHFGQVNVHRTPAGQYLVAGRP